jgi:hypothetical protein
MKGCRAWPSAQLLFAAVVVRTWRPARSNEADQYENSSADDDPEIVFAHVAHLGHLCLKVSFGECIMQKTGRSVNRGRQKAPDKDVSYGSAADEQHRWKQLTRR